MNKKNPAGKCDGKKGKKFPAQQVARKKNLPGPKSSTPSLKS